MVSRREYTDDEIIAFYRAKAKELGRAPTGNEIKNDPKMPALYHFTDIGLRTLRKLANARSRQHPNQLQNLRPFTKKYTHEMLLNQLRAKISTLKRRPTHHEINQDRNMASAPTFVSYFGGMEEAFRRAEEQ